MPLNNFNYQVAWSDFSERFGHPPGVQEDAEIHINYPQTYEYSIGRRGVTITTAAVNIELAAELCWVLSSQTSNMQLLAHEQGHYDITALGAREFYNGLINLNAANQTALEARIRRLRSSIQDQVDRANATYDRQSNHSQNTTAQQLWVQKIAAAKLNPAGTLRDLPG